MTDHGSYTPCVQHADPACSESHTEEAELSWLFKDYEQAKGLDALVSSSGLR